MSTIYYNCLTILHNVEPVGMPRNVSGNSTGALSISLKWAAPAPEKQNGKIRYYIVSVTEVNSGNVHNHTAYGEDITIFSLHPYYKYKVSVAAVTVAIGPFSNGVVIQTLEDGELLSQINIY